MLNDEGKGDDESHKIQTSHSPEYQNSHRSLRQTLEGRKFLFFSQRRKDALLIYTYTTATPLCCSIFLKSRTGRKWCGWEDMTKKWWWCGGDNKREREKNVSMCVRMVSSSDLRTHRFILLKANFPREKWTSYSPSLSSWKMTTLLTCWCFHGWLKISPSSPLFHKRERERERKSLKVGNCHFSRLKANTKIPIHWHFLHFLPPQLLSFAQLRRFTLLRI